MGKIKSQMKNQVHNNSGQYKTIAHKRGENQSGSSGFVSLIIPQSSKILKASIIKWKFSSKAGRV